MRVAGVAQAAMFIALHWFWVETMRLSLVPVCHRSEPLSQEPMSQWGVVHTGARTVSLPLFSSVPGKGMWNRYKMAAKTGTQLHKLTATTRSCVSIITVVLECSYKNGGCEQYCKDLPGGAGVQCGCADGYKLQSDGHRCSKTGDVITQHYLWFAENWHRVL